MECHVICGVRSHDNFIAHEIGPANVVTIASRAIEGNQSKLKQIKPHRN